jgi:dye decolorizing peroxidase
VTGPSSRRQFLGYLGAAAAGAAASVPVTARALGQPEDAYAPSTPIHTLSPYGVHQRGIADPTQRFVTLVALDLQPDTDADALGRLMRLWTGDVVALTQGRPAPGDTAPDLVLANTDLTVTVGWGPGVFDLPRLGPARPQGLVEIPQMRHDRLEDRWSGGDLLLVVGAHDGTTVEHVVRRMVADSAPFARPRWRQNGFWNGFGEDGAPATGRNLFGQVDGSGNAAPGTEVFDETVWASEPGWFAGGTNLVVRRIRMDLDSWDTLTRSEQERAVGRRLSDGAPLSGVTEKDDLDLSATEQGRLVIAERAHARLAHPTLNDGARIFRKGANYAFDDGSGSTESGLVFQSYQADIGKQFVPMQQRLDGADMLNEWTTAIGSAEFAVLPGFSRDGWLGETLLG